VTTRRERHPSASVEAQKNAVSSGFLDGARRARTADLLGAIRATFVSMSCRRLRYGSTTLAGVVALTAGGYRRQQITVSRSGGKLRVRARLIGRGFESQLVITSGSSPRAYVLTGGGTVYSIDPTTAQATAHVVPTPPDAPATSPQIMLLNAAPLGDNLVVSSFFPRPNGTTRAGVYLIDPATWTARLLDPTTPLWVTAGASLVTFTDAGGFRLPSSWLTKGTGVRIYDTNGNLRRHLYGNRAFEGIEQTPLFTAAILHTAPRNAAEPAHPR
jgi:hypothetical protein